MGSGVNNDARRVLNGGLRIPLGKILLASRPWGCVIIHCHYRAHAAFFLYKWLNTKREKNQQSFHAKSRKERQNQESFPLWKFGGEKNQNVSVVEHIGLACSRRVTSRSHRNSWRCACTHKQKERKRHCRQFIGLAHTIIPTSVSFKQDGATCLFLAAQNGHAKVVALILAAAAANPQLAIAMINNRRWDGATSLWMASQMGYDHVSYDILNLNYCY